MDIDKESALNALTMMEKRVAALRTLIASDNISGFNDLDKMVVGMALNYGAILKNASFDFRGAADNQKEARKWWKE